MEKERKIKPVVRKFSSFNEAEEAEDEYWAKITMEERLNALIELRKIFINNSDVDTRIEKIVTKRSIYEEAD
ncbi:hypothetical protein [Parafilimonas sp.]|uniref:hypothetical protein n=1 Tax=Parafilimonas sp. TaxID=1969739 RepID=UPI0039E6A80C